MFSHVLSYSNVGTHVTEEHIQGIEGLETVKKKTIWLMSGRGGVGEQYVFTDKVDQQNSKTKGSSSDFWEPCRFLAVK